MTTTTPTTTSPTGVRIAWARAARLMIGLSGVNLLIGATYFTFFATVEDGGVVSAFDWFVAVWALGLALTFLAVAVSRFASPRRWVEVARWVMGAHVLWGFVKLVAYEESPVSEIFLTVDAVILLLLWMATRSQRA